MSRRYYETIGAYTRLSGAWLRHEAPRKLKSPAFLALAYAAIGFVTFGHVAAAKYRADKYEYGQCDHNRKVNASNAYNSCWQPNPAMSALPGLGAGVFWPLYLSWSVQQ